MKKIMISVLLILSALPQAFGASGSGNVSNIVSIGGAFHGKASLPVNPPVATVPIGSYTDEYKTLYFRVNSGDANVYQAGYDPNTGAAYVAGSGGSDRFHIYRICGTNSSGGLLYAQGGYGDTAAPNTATPPTTPKYFSGRADLGIFTLDFTTSESRMTCFDTSIWIPSGKYPFMQNVTGGGALMFEWHGKEEP